MAAALPIQAVIRHEAKSHSSLGGAILDKTLVAATNWLELSTLTYTLDGAEDNPRTWDIAERTTRSADASADAVLVIATMSVTDDVPRILLVKQFRPPMNAVCVELPAGLIDAGESPGEAALRELKEETGFTGSVTSVGVAQCLSPGLSSETVISVTVAIDGQKSAGQALAESESIEVISVPVLRLREALAHMERNEMCAVHAALGNLAIGIEMGHASQMRLARK
jgi:8-oxo-dGTP pyrophosphatase MutT (NUDIX family)